MASTTEDDRPWQEPATPIVRGAFIVVEGLDRAGKTTQVKKLADKLYALGRNIKMMRFPGITAALICLPLSLLTCLLPDRTSPIGTMINSYLQSQTDMDDHVIHLLFSANRWESAYILRSSI